MTATDWIQAISMVVLAIITGVYAWRTHIISRATREQADASVKMAEEMREQRQGEARPSLLLRLNGEAIQWVDIEPNERRPTKFEVTIRNVGNGPAINLWAARWSHEKSFFGDSKGYLAPNEEWTTGISNISTMIVRLRAEKDIWLPELREVIENKYPGIVAVKYNDIHHRVWVSYLCLEWHHSVDGYVMEGDQNIVEVKEND